MAFGVPYQNYMPNYYMQQPMQPAMPDQLAQLRQNSGYTPQTAQQQPAQNSPIIWAQGEEAAKASFCAPGQSVLIMDIEKPVFYMKTVDVSGMPQPLRVFDYAERTAAQKQPAQAVSAAPMEYVTRAEFDELKAQILTQDKPKKKKEASDNEQPTV